MMLKKLCDTFKTTLALRQLHKKMKQPPAQSTRQKGIAHIGCIVDIDHFQNPEAFYELTAELAPAPKTLKIIRYTRKRGQTHQLPQTLPLFSNKDLGWNGNIKNNDVAEFTKREYDLLINYYQEDNLMLKLVSVTTVARLKVGLGTPNTPINDLILNTPLNNFTIFKSELKKYLTILNQL